MRPLVICFLSVFPFLAANAQGCPVRDDRGPAEASVASTLHGTILFHDELRQWLGLKLDQATCGQFEVQLVFSDTDAWRNAETLHGCSVTATGKLFDSPTGYYSAEVAISDPALKPDQSCHPSSIKADQPNAPPPVGLKSFRASITVDYRGKGHVDVRVWQSGTKALLQPSKSFVRYHLTGGQDVLWFGCREGFGVRRITQTPKSPHGFLEGDEDFPSTALVDMQGINKVEFNCEKKPDTISPGKS